MFTLELNIDTNKLNKARVPLMAELIAAGFPSPAADYIEENIDMNDLLIKHPAATFLIRTTGESMIEAYIPSNALLIVDRSLTAKNGDIIVGVIDGEFTVKRLVKTFKGVALYPENPKFKPIIITEEMAFVAWGVVTNIIIDPKDAHS